MLTGPRPDSPLVASPPGFSALNKVLAPAFYEKDTLTGLPTGRIFDEQGNDLSVVTAMTAAATGAAISLGVGSRKVLSDLGVAIYQERQQCGIRQEVRTGDSVAVWQPGAAYAMGDRIFPTAYNTPSTWSSGFVSAGGLLYCLVCVTAGTTATTEPTWKDPAVLTEWSFNNTGTGATQLDHTDGTVTWRARPVIYIDPTWGGTKSGTQLAPYDTWVLPSGTSAGYGSIYNDVNGAGATDQKYAGATYLQRAGTTYNSPSGGPAIRVRGPDSDTSTAYSTGSTETGRSPLISRRLTYGVYRKPGDTDNKAYLVGNGPNSTTADGVVYNDKRIWWELLDFDISNTQTGSGQHGILSYHDTSSTGSGNRKINIAGVNVHDCVGGSGMVIATYGGNSNDVGQNGFLISDSNFYGNQSFGTLVTGNFKANNNLTSALHSVRYDRCASWDNGASDAPAPAHHGFSSIAFRKVFGDGIGTGAAGWTLTSGTTYSRAVGSPAAGTLTTINALYGAIMRSEGGIFPAPLRQNTTTPTTPAVGEFGYSASTIYVNLGAAIDVRTQLIFQLARCQDIQYNNCEAYDNHTILLSGTAVEGHGFASDEFSSATFTNCYSHDNEQSGILIHYSNSSKVISGVYSRNASSGIYPTCAINTLISGANIHGNTGNGVQTIYGSSRTTIVDSVISGNNRGVAWYSDMTNPPLAYDVSAWPYKSTVVGGRNVLWGNSMNYGKMTLADSAYVSQPLLAGDRSA